MPARARSLLQTPPARWEGALVLAIVTGALVVGALRLTPRHDWGDDFASYVMQAESLWAGDTRGFVERNSFTILRSSHRLGPIAYPWGYPLLLVPSVAIAGLDPLALKIPGLLLFGTFLVALHLLMRTGLDRRVSLLVLLLFAFHPDLLDFLDLVLSDIPFLFLSTLALLLMERMDARPPPAAARCAWLGAVVFAAFFTRTVGILLLGVLVAPLAWKAWRLRPGGEREGGAARPAVIGILVFGLLWLASRQVLPDGQTSYPAPGLGVSLSTAWQNAGRYGEDAMHFLAGRRSHPAISSVLIVAAIAGAATRRRENLRFLAYLGLTVGVLLAWPEYQGLRFLFPVLPVLAFFIVAGMRAATARLPPRIRSPALVALCASWVAMVGVDGWMEGRRPIEGGPGGGPFDVQSTELFRFIRAETKPDSVIVFFKPRAMRLMTGRDAFMGTDCDRVARGDYLVLHKGAGGSDQMTPDALRACGAVREVAFENATFVARRIR